MESVIKAYTFESVSDDLSKTQIRPYSAKVDARVRRDMFNGHGNLIFTGNKNGYVNIEALNTSISAIKSAGELVFELAEHVTFCVGGRLFTTKAEQLKLNVEVSNESTIIASTFVDVNTVDKSETFVKFSETPHYPQDISAWELDNFSVKFDFIIVPNSNTSVHVFPAPWHNAQLAANSTMNISDPGVWMNGVDAKYRGEMVSDYQLMLSQSGGVFTLSGVSDKIRKVDDKILFGDLVSIYSLNITKGYCIIFLEHSILMGDLSSDDTHQFILTNVKVVTGNDLDTTFLHKGSVIATFTANWGY